jgi:tetratricopeptide (TPR) repeat protein
MDKVIKKYPPESLKRRAALLPTIVVLLIVAVFLQTLIDPQAAQYHEGEGNITEASTGLNNEFLLLPLLGFREAAAGLLWVRCDEFFHSGDYDAILPLVRLITWLDPHADNIYVTGAWHLAYNFTDSSERSDRRYIAPAQALLDEGIRNNMGIPDIKFEKGWQAYDKIKDYLLAEKAFVMAEETKPMRESDDYPWGAPLKTLHILAHTYEKEGKLPLALATWKRAIERSKQMIAKNDKDYSTKQLNSAEIRNFNEALQRYWDRYLPDQSKHSKVNPTAYAAINRPDGGMTKPSPWDVAFQPHIDVTRPKVLKISGQFNSADGARVDVRITDWDFQEKVITGEISNFDIDLSQTILIDSISVRKNHFEREMDMSKDPKMYGFNQPYYRITLSYNPRATSPFLQDRFGWSGEGITDSNASHVYVNPNPALLGTKLVDGFGGTGANWDGSTIPVWPVPADQAQNPVAALPPPWYHPDEKPTEGQPPRTIRVVYKVSKEQILGQKPITDQDIVPSS